MHRLASRSGPPVGRSSPPRRRRPAAAFAVFAIAILAAPMAVAANACPPSDAQPRVSMITLPGDLYYDTSRTSQELERLQGKRASADRRRGWHPIGLTLTELQFRMQISVNAAPRNDNTHCAVVSAVDASLGYDKITIYVDRRYPPGSCQYQSVLDHENLHLAVFRDTLAAFAPTVERRLNEAAQKLKPVVARTAEQAAAKLQKALQREVEPIFNDMNRRMDAENGRLDNKENYLHEQSRCSKW